MFFIDYEFAALLQWHRHALGAGLEARRFSGKREAA
jgi:hypothetical protein